MSSRFHGALWCLVLVLLTVYAAVTAFSPWGVQWFGRNIPWFCGASLVFLVPLTVMQFRQLVAGRVPTTLHGPQVWVFLVPLLVLPWYLPLDGGAQVALAKALPPPPSADAPSVDLPPEGTITLGDDHYHSYWETLNDGPDQYSGREVSFRGFGYPISADGKLWFFGRLLLACCPSDGIPEGFEVEIPAGTPLGKPMTWWEVRGTITPFTETEDRDPNTGIWKGSRVPRLVLRSVQPSKIPTDPFVYLE